MPRYDLSIETNDGIFSCKVAAIIIRDGFILALKDVKQSYYYGLGGTVRLNESTEDAVIREVFEKTGVPLEIDKLLHVQEQFYESEEQRQHDVVFYYLMKVDSATKIPSIRMADRVNNESLRWLPIIGLNTYKIIPEFLKTFRMDKTTRFTHSISMS